MEHIELTDFHIRLLRYLKNQTAFQTMEVKSEFMPMGISEREIDQALYFFQMQKWTERDRKGNDFLNETGLSVLTKIDNDIANRSKTDIELIERNLNEHWWDRIIDNGQKILNVIFVGVGLLVAIQTYNQVDKGDDIKELQKLRVKDSLQFSTTLRDVENKLIQQRTQLEQIRSPSKLDSMDSRTK